MKKSLRTLSSLLAAVMLASVVTACGGGNSSADTSTVDQENGSTTGETITVFLDSAKSQNTVFLDIIAEYNDLGGDQVEMNVLPGDATAAMQKMDILMSSGDETDVIMLDNPTIQSKYTNAGYLAPLNPLAESEKVDLDEIYGQYLVKNDEGQSYYLRTDVGKWYVFYNKQIFDDAKVAYPSGKWTWSEYIETAQKLTNLDKGIYGSLMPDYDNILYFTARQKDVPAYKEDGTSNLDDPAYKEALKFYGDLGSQYKIQPSWSEYKTQKIAWDAFMTGNYGMQLIGGWYTGVLTDSKTYPITWQWGMTLLPVPDSGDGDRTLVAGGAFGVNQNSKHKEAAFNFVNYLSQNLYKKNKSIPPLQNVSEADQNELLKSIADSSAGSVTVEELRDVIFDDTLGVADEKISGAGSSIISQTILQEGELYLVGQKSLDDAIAAIKEKSDRAIEAEAK